VMHRTHLPLEGQRETRSRQQNRRGERLVHTPLQTSVNWSPRFVL